MSELIFGLNQTQKKKEVKKYEKSEKDELWNYKSKEMNGLEVYRASQTRRESDWKKTGRDQKAANSTFDMARSLFGPGGAMEGMDNDYDENEDLSSGTASEHPVTEAVVPEPEESAAEEL